MVDLQLSLVPLLIDSVLSRHFPDHMVQVENLIFSSVVCHVDIIVLFIRIVDTNHCSLFVKDKGCVFDIVIVQQVEVDLVVGNCFGPVDINGRLLFVVEGAVLRVYTVPVLADL